MICKRERKIELICERCVLCQQFIKNDVAKKKKMWNQIKCRKIFFAACKSINQVTQSETYLEHSMAHKLNFYHIFKANWNIIQQQQSNRYWCLMNVLRFLMFIHRAHVSVSFTAKLILHPIFIETLFFVVIRVHFLVSVRKPPLYQFVFIVR